MPDIKVNATEWNPLPEESKAKITSIMKDHGFLTGSDKVAGDANAPKAEEVVAKASAHLLASAKAQKAAAGKGTPSPQLFGIDFCKIGCDLAEGAAIAACGVLPPPANGICVAAAHVAGDFCRSKC